MVRDSLISSCVQVVVPGSEPDVVAKAAAESRDLCVMHEYAQSQSSVNQFWESFACGPWPPNQRFPAHPLAVLCWKESMPQSTGAAAGRSANNAVCEKKLMVQACALWRRSGLEAELDYVVCAPEARGSGLGALALQVAAAALWGLGVETLLLEVSRQNTKALQLYARLGYRQVAVRKGYYRRSGPPEDAVVMVSELQSPFGENPE